MNPTPSKPVPCHGDLSQGTNPGYDPILSLSMKNLIMLTMLFIVAGWFLGVPGGPPSPSAQKQSVATLKTNQPDNFNLEPSVAAPPAIPGVAAANQPTRAPMPANCPLEPGRP